MIAQQDPNTTPYDTQHCDELLAKKLYSEGLLCLMELYSIGDRNSVVDQIIDHLLSKKYKIEQIVEIFLKFADDLKSLGDIKLAVNILKKAKEFEPTNLKLIKRIQTLSELATVVSKYEKLLKKGVLTTSQLEQAIESSYNSSKSIEYVLEKELGIPKAEIGECLSQYYKCPFMAYDPNYKLPGEIIKNLKKSFLIHEHWIPVSWGKDGVKVLIDDPLDLKRTGGIKGLLRTPKLQFLVGTREDIELFIEKFFEELSLSKAEPLDQMVKSLESMPDITLEEEKAEEITFLDESNSQVVKFVDQVILLAYRERASDIHIEPSTVTKKVHVRFRIDGVLKEITQVPINLAPGIISRLKIIANLDISEKRLPQDGKIIFRRKGVPEFELRLATIPVVGGLEDAVLRILAKAGTMKLEDMGITPSNLLNLRQIISQPYGLILVVGPTGSGKTTTLHAILGELNKPGVKVLTAEDPVEITQHGLRQVEVKPKIGLDFARVMRAFLRADPDIIMIGEMRDQETASIAIEASLTGHLVLSTLHTNSAPETVTRLLDMGLNPLNFSDAFLGILAQRLVRRLCPKCKEPYTPSEEERQFILKELGGIKDLRIPEQLILYKPRGSGDAMGCEYCSHTGYRGRTAIHELMRGTPEIKRLIRKEAPTDELFAQAQKDGMLTLKQDGLLKVIEGITDLSELRRVVIN